MAGCIPRRIGVNLETTSDTYRSFQADLRIGLFYCPETGKVKVTARLTPGNSGTKACTHTQVGAILPDAHLPHQIEAR